MEDGSAGGYQEWCGAVRAQAQTWHSVGYDCVLGGRTVVLGLQPVGEPIEATGSARVCAVGGRIYCALSEQQFRGDHRSDYDLERRCADRKSTRLNSSHLGIS